jgi:hypothetical protein
VLQRSDAKLNVEEKHPSYDEIVAALKKKTDDKKVTMEEKSGSEKAFGCHAGFVDISQCFSSFLFVLDLNSKLLLCCLFLTDAYTDAVASKDSAKINKLQPVADALEELKKEAAQITLQVIQQMEEKKPRWKDSGRYSFPSRSRTVLLGKNKFASKFPGIGGFSLDGLQLYTKETEVC